MNSVRKVPVQVKGSERPSDPEPSKKRPINRMPAGSVFYDRIIPLLLVGMGVVLVAMILLAAGVLLGLIPFT